MYIQVVKLYERYRAHIFNKKIAIFCVRLLDIEVKDIFPAIHFFLSDLL